MTGKLEGIFIALTSPFEDGAFSAAKADANVRRFNRTSVAGYVVMGSTGESVSLDDRESLAALESVIGAADASKTVIAGTARESTAWTIGFTRACASAGARAALVRPPSYFKSKMTREAQRAFFLSVAEGSPIPIIIYNIPQNVGYSIEPGLVIELAGHPNIIGLKESSANIPMLGDIMREVDPGFSYFLGSGHVLLPGFVMGACGAILAAANIAPDLACAVLDSFRQGDLDAARRAQMEFIPLNRAFTMTWGIAGVKYAMDLLGLYGGPVRPPLLPLGDKDKAALASLLKGCGLI